MHSAIATPPPSQARLAGIDACRGIAAVLVVLFHAEIRVSSIFQVDPFDGSSFFGKRGVDFFFVLSGFIIAYAHWGDLGRSDRILLYVKKRFIRVYPLLWVVAFPLLLVKLLTNAEDLPAIAWDRFCVVVTSLTLLPSAYQPIPVVVWTLRFELFFYLVFACVLWKPKYAVGGLLIWAILCIKYSLTEDDQQFPASFFLAPYNLEFMLGVGSAYLLKTRTIPCASYVALAGTALFFVLGVNYNIHHSVEGHSAIEEFYFVCQFGLVSALIVLGIGQLDLVSSNPWVSPSLRLLGSASYSIYLSHFPLISIVCGLLKVVSKRVPISPYLCAIVAVCASLVFGVLLHLLIEQPIISWLRPAKSHGAGRRLNEVCAVAATPSSELN